MVGGAFAMPDQKRRPASTRAPAEGQTPYALSERIGSDIAMLVAEVHRRMLGTSTPPPSSQPVRLDLVYDPAGSDGLARALLEQVERAVREESSRADALQPGRIYCYRCESSACEHAAPPGSRTVFAGYGPTGQPIWTEFGQYLLEQRHPRVGEIFMDRPPTVGVVVFGRQLKGRQLHSFGRASKSYDPLAQLAAGYFGPGGESGSRPDRVAISVQIVESRRATGGSRLAMNLIGVAPESAPIDDYLADHAPEFHDALRAARRRLKEIESNLGHRSGSDRSEVLRHVPGVLVDLRRALERLERQRTRRTHHVEKRRADHRPTHAASRDAARAGADAIFFDRRRETLIVLGPRGRAHAFTVDGRHVTSLVLDSESLSRRIARGRFRPATLKEIENLRSSLSSAPEAAQSPCRDDGEPSDSNAGRLRQRTDRP
jgi:hypothetical protein